jgi:hypothetical protein
MQSIPYETVRMMTDYNNTNSTGFFDLLSEVLLLTCPLLETPSHSERGQNIPQHSSSKVQGGANLLVSPSRESTVDAKYKECNCLEFTVTKIPPTSFVLLSSA